LHSSCIEPSHHFEQAGGPYSAPATHAHDGALGAAK
jgi:hypothetical protein